MSEIVIYSAKDGHVELDVNLADETVWLTLNRKFPALLNIPLVLTELNNTD